MEDEMGLSGAPPAIIVEILAKKGADWTSEEIGRFVEWFIPELLRYALHRWTFGGVIEAADAVNEFALELSQGNYIGNFDPKKGTIWFIVERFRMFLGDFRKRKGSRPCGQPFPLDDDGQVVIQIVSNEPDPLNALEQNESVEHARVALQAALHQLKPDHRDIIIHVDLKGEPLLQYAKRVSIAHNVARQRHRRALIELKEKLAESPLRRPLKVVSNSQGSQGGTK
jgi:RNA polymerase sigma factor (sigma-70 family)